MNLRNGGNGDTERWPVQPVVARLRAVRCCPKEANGLLSVRGSAMMAVSLRARLIFWFSARFWSMRVFVRKAGNSSS